MGIDFASYTSPQMKLVQEMCQGLLKKDMNLFGQHFHKDFCRVFHPQSLGKPPMKRDEWLAKVAGVFSSPVPIECTWNSVVEAPGKVVLHASLNTMGSSGQNVTDESIWIIEFTSGEDGSLKVKGLEQFISTDHIEFFHATK